MNIGWIVVLSIFGFISAVALYNILRPPNCLAPMINIGGVCTCSTTNNAKFVPGGQCKCLPNYELDTNGKCVAKKTE